MARLTTTFSLEQQPEVFFSTTQTSRAIRRLLEAGEVRRIEGRLYTKNLTDPPADIVRRRVWDVAAGYFPGAVIVDRTAFELRPAGQEGSVFLCSGTRRIVRLPGVVLNCRRGTGPVSGDKSFIAGMSLSSWPRRLLDNMRLSRARTGISRTLRPIEIERQLRMVRANQGMDELNRLRDEARKLSGELDAEAEYRRLSNAIEALEGANA
jgi:hypothetical protein